MNNFLVEKCASCLKQNVPLFDAMDENERYYKLVKHNVIIRELFCKDFFQEVHNCKLCEVCSVLLKGAVVLEKGLFSSQLMYNNYLKTSNENSHRSSSEIPNLSMQKQEPGRKYVMIPETTSNVTDSEDVCAETEVQLDVFETDVIDTKDIKIEIDETNYETMLNDFNSETTIHIKIETENETIAESPAGNVTEYNDNKQVSNGAKDEGSTGCSRPNAGTATDAVDADHHEAKAAKSNCQKISFNCNICNRKFAKKLLLVTHSRAHMEGKPFECNICGRKFSALSNFVRHNRFHAKRNFRAKTFSHKSNVDTDQTQIRTAEKPYKCDICGKAFSYLSRWDAHRRVHALEKPYKCDLCAKAYKFKSSCRRHVHSHSHKHMAEKPYKCDLCPKMYAHEESFVVHRRTHTGEKPFKCDLCEKAFADAKSCARHRRRIHAALKPHKCSECGKAFAERSGYRAHMRIHTADKPHECDLCSMRFSHVSCLSRHKLTHTDELQHECDMCGKAFAQKADVRRHKLTHTGEKPYKCDACGKAFAHKWHCESHKRTHTGEKPYKCDLCAKEFSQRSNLNGHRKRAHSTGKVLGMNNEPEKK